MYGFTRIDGGGGKDDLDLEAGGGSRLYPGLSAGENELRWGFVRKVYGILCAQVVLTTAVLAATMLYRPMNDLLTDSSGLALVLAILPLVLLLPLYHYQQKHPLNFVFLGLFTVCLSLSVGVACANTEGRIVLEALIITSGVVLSLTGYTFWASKKGKDFSYLALPRCASDVAQKGQWKCPSLMELCVAKIREDINKYSTFSMLPKDISQQIFNELVESHCLSDSSLEAFRDCALEDIHLGEYPGVKDSWMDVITSQGQSLLSLDISCSDVTDSGLVLLRGSSNLQSLKFNYCDQISENGLENISGLSNLTTLSFKKSTAINAEGMKAFTSLVNLVNLDLERCLEIHGGLIHLKGLNKLETLNIRYCNCIRDGDMKPLSGLTNLKELQMSCCRVTDVGIAHLKGLTKLALLNLEGCPVTAACLEYISGLSLLYLNLSRCCISDDGCEKFSGLGKLKILNLGFNRITDKCLVHLKDLINLESLNLDSCKIGDEGLLNLKGLLHLKSLELSDTEVGSSGLRHLSGLCGLESINLSFTSVSDNGLRKLSGLTSLRSLNLDSRFITDAGISSLTTLTGLTHLDLFGARITDSGTNCFRFFKNLRSLEVCGGSITDAGVKNIKDLTSLTHLNLSQNGNLTDKTLELISGLSALVSLNVSNSCVTNDGLQHLKPLMNLRSLTLESCKVTATEIKKLQLAALPNLVNFRPE